MGAVIVLLVLRMPGLLKNLESVDEVANETKLALLQGRLICFDLYFTLPIYYFLWQRIQNFSVFRELGGFYELLK